MKKKTMALGALILLSACGRSNVDSEVTGQAKRIVNQTPIICPDYKSFDLSLGIMRNGVGSMSTQDMFFTVGPGVDINALRTAVENGSLIKARYDRYRFTICVDESFLTGFEIIN